MQNKQYEPKWEKGVYPSDEYLRSSINNQELYIGTLDENIVCAMIVNHECNESYSKAEWSTRLKPNEITVIHALGVHPDFSRKGFAKEMVTKVIDIAKSTNQKAIRLDVLKGNTPAENLYLSAGFKYVDTIQMYYEDTGWTDFKLYEYNIVI